MQKSIKCILLRASLIAVIISSCSSKHFTTTTDSSNVVQINSKSFQAHFLNELTANVDMAAKSYLNQFFLQLQSNANYAPQCAQLCQEAQRPTLKLEQKILLVKQLLDLQHYQHNNGNNNNSNKNSDQQLDLLYILRNVNFLKRIKQQLQQMQSESAKEIRKMRVFEICKQFQKRNGNKTESRFSPDNPPYSASTKLVPLNEQNIGIALKRLNQSVSINPIDFGRQLYARIKTVGSEIIDDYLDMLQELLEEVLSEKPDSAERAAAQTPEPTAIKKLLHEIETILNIVDFYEKRQRLYYYLEYNLPKDFDQFQNTASSQQDLTHIFYHVKEQGMDLFVAFLFSNFEFLERLHEEWSNLLPADAVLSNYYEDSQVFYKINQLYKSFKEETENNNGLYETYMQEVGSLFNRTVNISEHTHVFQLLHSSSENLGGVTLNIIREKCNEQ